MKTDLFQSCGHGWVFQIYWHIECSAFIASSFRIWNLSAGIPSPPLSLFIVMLPKVHLTSHFRMSHFSWVITPSWLSRSWISFLYSSVYSRHLFLVSSASIRSLAFMSFIVLFYSYYSVIAVGSHHGKASFGNCRFKSQVHLFDSKYAWSRVRRNLELWADSLFPLGHCGDFPFCLPTSLQVCGVLLCSVEWC